MIFWSIWSTVKLCVPNLTFHDICISFNSPLNNPSWLYFCYCCCYVSSVYGKNILTLTVFPKSLKFVPVQLFTSVTFLNPIRHHNHVVILQFYMIYSWFPCKNEYLVDTGVNCTDCNLLSNSKYNIYLLIKQCISYVWYAIFFKAIKHYRVILSKALIFWCCEMLFLYVNSTNKKASMELASREDQWM